MITIDIPIISNYFKSRNKKDLLSTIIDYIKDNKSSVLSYGVNNISNSTTINITLKSTKELDFIVYDDATKK